MNETKTNLIKNTIKKMEIIRYKNYTALGL